MTLFSWAMVTTCESTNASPMLVLSCELNVLGIVVMACFSGILSIIFYRDLGSKCVTKPYGKYHGGLLNGLGI